MSLLTPTFVAGEAVDVVLPLKNANKSVLMRCLASLFWNVPVNRLIVVDGGNASDVIALLAKKYNTEFIEDQGGNRATARQKGIESVETKWHLHIDGDVILCLGWFEKARPYMNEGNVGLIWGWDRIADPHSRNRMKAMYYLRRISEYELMKRNFQHRGGMHDTLLQTSIVKDIEIPADLHVFEDWYIRRHVEAKGFQCIVDERLWCLHYLTGRFTLEHMREIAKLQKKYAIQSVATTVRNFLLAPFKCGAVFAVSGGDLQATRDQWNMYAYNLLGVFA